VARPTQARLPFLYFRHGPCRALTQSHLADDFFAPRRMFFSRDARLGRALSLFLTKNYHNGAQSTCRPNGARRWDPTKF